MRRHKPATAVTVAPQTEKTPFGELVERYWKLGLGLAVVVIAGILISQYFEHQEGRVRDGSWERLLAQTQMKPYPRIPTADPAVLANVAADLRGQHAGPWAKLLEVNARLEADDSEGAQAAAQELIRSYPEHPLVRETYGFPHEVAPVSIVQHLVNTIDRKEAWDAQHPEFSSNPALAADAPRVRLTTDAGVIVVGLYADRAPRHVENFLKLVREGFYDGTKFHRVISGYLIQGGDPNSKSPDASTWGQGGPGYKVDSEPNELRHFAGVLSAAKQPGEEQSSGSQFFITTAPVHGLDGQHVVFGQVLEGMDVVSKIEAAPIAPGTGDRPEAPVGITQAEVL
jgi:cyclophilin family peptidyl-prolyl cis-trans isomerase